MRIGCIIQARTTSARLPNKVNMDIGGWPMWRHVFERMKAFNPIMAWAHEYPHLNEMDVLGRYTECAKSNGLDTIMRVTGDCPLIDPEACREVLDRFIARGKCYAANDLIPSYPRGLGCEVMSLRELIHANIGTHSDKGREHVTGAIRKAVHVYDANVLCPYGRQDHLNFSVDTQEDLDLVREIDARLPAGDGKYRLENTLYAYEAVLAQR